MGAKYCGKEKLTQSNQITGFTHASALTVKLYIWILSLSMHIFVSTPTQIQKENRLQVGSSSFSINANSIRHFEKAKKLKLAAYYFQLIIIIIVLSIVKYRRKLMVRWSNF